MDIDLLSKMISELIVDHDRVGLPGVGTFYTEVVPSTFSDRGYTINPPYRRLSFLPNAVENDLLVNFYSDVNGTPADMAREYIVQFLRELAEALKEHKTITLPGLGRLRATKENNFFFVADEDLDIYPEAFGLAPVSLKNIPGLDDDKVDIRFEFKPPVRKAAEPEPAYAASVEPAEPEITVEPVGPAAPAVSAELSTTASSEVFGAEPDAAAPETSEPSAPAAEPVSGDGTSAAAETAATQESASESAEGAEVFPGTDATAEPEEPVQPTEPAALSASAATAAVAEPAKVAAPAETAAPAVPAETAASAELTETAEPAESAKPAELIEPAEPAVTAEPEASMPEPEAEAPKAAGAGEGAAEPAEPGALANCAEETRVVEEDDGQTEKKLPSAERIPAPAAEEDDGRTVKKFRWWIPLLVLSALAAIFLAVFLILAHVAPDFIDSILYTPEELRIINY